MVRDNNVWVLFEESWVVTHGDWRDHSPPKIEAYSEIVGYVKGISKAHAWIDVWMKKNDGECHTIMPGYIIVAHGSSGENRYCATARCFEKEMAVKASTKKQPVLRMRM